MGEKKSTEGGWELYHFDPVAMDERLNTNPVQQIGNELLRQERKRK